MISGLFLAKLLLLHWVADFVLQSRDMAKNKSSSVLWLLAHLTIQFLVFWPFTGWKFALANAAIHGLIDWNIWKLYKISVFLRSKRFNPKQVPIKDFKFWEDSLFYMFIGIDQFLHMSTIIGLLIYGV